MKYFRENKELLLKYLFIIITNIIIYLLSNFYFKGLEYKDLIMLLLIVVMDFVIYYYRETRKFVFYLDLLANIVVGMLLMLFTKDTYLYTTALFSLVFSNNIIFMRSRFSEKFFKKTFQYFMIVIYTLIVMFLCVFVFIALH